MLAASFTLDAQVVGKQFPDMETETLEDKKVTFPMGLKGKYSIVGLAYSKKSEDELNSWLGPVYATFLQESDGGFFSFTYDINVCFVAMFTGVNAAAAGTAKRRAVRNVPPELFPHFFFYKGDLQPYKEALEFDRSDIPYLFVLNSDGKIVYTTSGTYSQEKLDAMEELIE